MRSFSHYNKSLDGIIESVFITGHYAIVTFRDTPHPSSVQENSTTLSIPCQMQADGRKLIFRLEENTRLPVPPIGAIIKMQQLLIYLAPSRTDRDFLLTLPDRYTHWLNKKAEPRYQCSVPALIAFHRSEKLSDAALA